MYNKRIISVYVPIKTEARISVATLGGNDVEQLIASTNECSLHGKKLSSKLSMNHVSSVYFC